MRAYVVADVFTDVPLQGNPVAVFTDAEGLSTDVMQSAARELNLSETVFVLPPDDDARADAHIRIFTPALELPFAGHPVLGTAFVLGEALGTDTVRLQTGNGVVPVALERRDGAIVSGEMDQPLPTWNAYDRGDELLAAVGVSRSELPVEVYDNGPRHAYVRLADEAAVAALSPDLGALSRLGAVGVSCFAVGEGHVKTRMFGPGLGVAEDPATGSAAGPLAVHLARHGVIGFGERVEIHQGAEVGRPSMLYARAEGSADRLERVAVGGVAVVVARGEFRLD
ncbi:MAG: PhzF family phenazine biosynthesis protein [Solirubrobacteraceae bacterium]